MKRMAKAIRTNQAYVVKNEYLIRSLSQFLMAAPNPHFRRFVYKEIHHQTTLFIQLIQFWMATIF